MTGRPRRRLENGDATQQLSTAVDECPGPTVAEVAEAQQERQRTVADLLREARRQAQALAGRITATLGDD